MRQAIRNLSDRAEFFLVVIFSLSYYVATSALVLLMGLHRVEMTTGRALRGALVESVILAIVALFLKARGWTFERLGLKFSVAASAFGVILFLAYYLWYSITAIVASLFLPSLTHMQPFQFTITAAPVAMIAFIIVNSFFEEIIVSSYVITALSPQGAALSITASTLLRLLYHLYQGPLASISILPLGLVFGAVFWKWRSAWPLIVAHTIANLISFMVLALR